MEEYEIGSILSINGRPFEIIDSWIGSKLVKINNENTIIDVEYVNLKDEHGKIIGPIEFGITE